MTTQLLGYARVSTKKQTTDQQLDALMEAGVDPMQIYSDVLSGARHDRPGLKALLQYAREGDTIVVVALHRLGRSLNHMVATIEELCERGINLRSLREGIDFSTPAGLQAHLFAMARCKRALIKERAAVRLREARPRAERSAGEREPSARPHARPGSTARRMREGGVQHRGDRQDAWYEPGDGLPRHRKGGRGGLKSSLRCSGCPGTTSRGRPRFGRTPRSSIQGERTHAFESSKASCRTAGEPDSVGPLA